MQSIQFQVRGEYIELYKLLKAVNVCESGGAAGILIRGGEVRVDGKVELRKACKIQPGQVVEAGDVRISVQRA